MRAVAALASDPSFAIHEVTCDAGPGPMSEPEETARFAIVLPRRGRFSRQVNGVEYLVDATTGYLELPDQEQRVGHPCAGGDVCTVVTVSPDLVESTCDPERIEPGPLLPAPSLALRHRLLLAACRDGDPGAASDHVVELAATAIGLVKATEQPARASAVHHRRLMVDRARQALEGDVNLTLPEVAARAGCSPHHLSRVFPTIVGCSVTDYRTQLRLVSVLDRLAAGDPNLATVAAEAGFSDHAHLTRVMKRHLGEVPSVLRRALARQAP